MSGSIVRALTVRQPHARRIVFSGKSPENRTWDTSFRGGLWIHAGLAFDRSAPALVKDGPVAEMARGAIIGRVDVVGTHHSDGCRVWCTRWSLPDSWHWELANPVALPEPVPCRGALGLWRVPDDVLAQLTAGAR